MGPEISQTMHANAVHETSVVIKLAVGAKTGKHGGCVNTVSWSRRVFTDFRSEPTS